MTGAMTSIKGCGRRLDSAAGVRGTHSHIHHPGKFGAGMMKPQVNVIMK
jgi:hypothetical protein